MRHKLGRESQMEPPTKPRKLDVSDANVYWDAIHAAKRRSKDQGSSGVGGAARAPERCRFDVGAPTATPQYARFWLLYVDAATMLSRDLFGRFVAMGTCVYLLSDSSPQGGRDRQVTEGWVEMLERCSRQCPSSRKPSK